MAVVIGNNTTVSFSQGACAISVNWGYSPNVQRFYCLGQWQADDNRTIYKPVETINITIYAPGSSSSILPTQSCTNASPTVTASVSPAACGGAAAGMSGSWYVTGYNYNKDDPVGPGQESWSMTRWIAGTNTPAPTYILRSISEGQASHVNGAINSGVLFTGTTADSSTGSVSANAVGRADTVYIGQVVSVGGGTNTMGETGSASVSIPYIQLYV